MCLGPPRDSLLHPPPPPPPQWWTLGTPYRTLAELAGFENKPVDWVQSRLSEESAAADIQQGKAPAQVALDQAALLMVRGGRTHGDIKASPADASGWLYARLDARRPLK